LAIARSLCWIFTPRRRSLASSLAAKWLRADEPETHNTVSNVETGDPAAIKKALEKAGVEFTNGKRPGVSQ
jgi:hypothetical protein